MSSKKIIEYDLFEVKFELSVMEILRLTKKLKKLLNNLNNNIVKDNVIKILNE